MKPPFPRLHYDDAIKLIAAKGSKTEWGSDFGGTDETVIADLWTASHDARNYTIVGDPAVRVACNTPGGAL